MDFIFCNSNNKNNNNKNNNTNNSSSNNKNGIRSNCNNLINDNNYNNNNNNNKINSNNIISNYNAYKQTSQQEQQKQQQQQPQHIIKDAYFKVMAVMPNDKFELAYAASVNATQTKPTTTTTTEAKLTTMANGMSYFCSPNVEATLAASPSPTLTTAKAKAQPPQLVYTSSLNAHVGGGGGGTNAHTQAKFVTAERGRTIAVDADAGRGGVGAGVGVAGNLLLPLSAQRIVSGGETVLLTPLTMRAQSAMPVQQPKQQQQQSKQQQQYKRVTVQHMVAPTKLENNTWNTISFYALNTDKTNNNTNNNNNNNFINDNNNKNNDNTDHVKVFNKSASMNYAAPIPPSPLATEKTATATATTTTTIPIGRTEDQENAFRRIEDVHNYAKLSGSSNSSIHDDDDEEDDEDEDEEEDNDNNDDVPEVEDDDNNDDAYDDDHDDGDGDDVVDEGDIDYKQRGTRKQQSLVRTSSDMAAMRLKCIEKTAIKAMGQAFDGDGDGDYDEYDSTVDVMNMPHGAINNGRKGRATALAASSKLGTATKSSSTVTTTAPDHHARRPMNAFLIFCKRHRAIVKDRYKSLENRAITKILGDWWASLDANDKSCFTDLAQQNKEAFFSANPNFKWYKLPAPPLRTLSTRPNNTNNNINNNNSNYNSNELAEAMDTALIAMPSEPDTPLLRSSREYSKFKLADETEMGDLNSLFGDSRRLQQRRLQQALCETSAYLSAHMPHAHGLSGECSGETAAPLQTNASAFVVGLGAPRKRTRSCKGKIYQELVNSGQIAPIAKKVKLQPNYTSNASGEDVAMDGVELQHQQHAASTNNWNEGTERGVSGKRRVVSESSCTPVNAALHMLDLQHFNLDERIKGLPALSLDAYLQRKRSTKRKKKFSTKKRQSGNPLTAAVAHNSKSQPTIATAATTTTSKPTTSSTPTVETFKNVPTNSLASPTQQQQQQLPQAVGSQKRKARKESITRRDVSAVEHEVASIINGCYYFNEAPAVTSTQQAATSSPPPLIAVASSLSSPSSSIQTPLAIAVNTLSVMNSNGRNAGGCAVPMLALNGRSDSNGSNSSSISSSSIGSNSSSSSSNSSFNVSIINDVAVATTVSAASSTSDLLILAEAAAKRTQLSN